MKRIRLTEQIPFDVKVRYRNSHELAISDVTHSVGDGEWVAYHKKGKVVRINMAEVMLIVEEFVKGEA